MQQPLIQSIKQSGSTAGGNVSHLAPTEQTVQMPLAQVLQHVSQALLCRQHFPGGELNLHITAGSCLCVFSSSCWRRQ